MCAIISTLTATPDAATPHSGAPDSLDALRRVVGLTAPPPRLVSFGVPSLDQALSGGLACAAVHEIGPAAPLHGGAAAAFAAVLTLLALGRHARQRRQPGWGVWIEPDFDAAEAGAPYGPGLDLLGLLTERLVMLRVARRRDALWAMEEALKCRAVGAVVAEIEESDLLVTRRLALAAGEGGGLGLILRNTFSPVHAPSAVMTRWEVASARSAHDRFGGLGPTTFALSLVKNRRGRTGQWLLAWNHHERAFVAETLPLPVAAAARDGPADALPGRLVQPFTQSFGGAFARAG